MNTARYRLVRRMVKVLVTLVKRERQKIPETLWLCLGCVHREHPPPTPFHQRPGRIMLSYCVGSVDIEPVANKNGTKLRCDIGRIIKSIIKSAPEYNNKNTTDIWSVVFKYHAGGFPGDYDPDSRGVVHEKR